MYYYKEEQANFLGPPWPPDIAFFNGHIIIIQASNFSPFHDNDRCSNCTEVLQSVEGEMTRSNLMRVEHKRGEEQREVEAKQLRETLKVASSLESEARQQPSKEPVRTTAKKGSVQSTCSCTIIIKGMRTRGPTQNEDHKNELKS